MPNKKHHTHKEAVAILVKKMQDENLTNADVTKLTKLPSRAVGSFLQNPTNVGFAVVKAIYKFLDIQFDKKETKRKTRAIVHTETDAQKKARIKLEKRRSVEEHIARKQEADFYEY